MSLMHVVKLLRHGLKVLWWREWHEFVCSSAIGNFQINVDDQAQISSGFGGLMGSI